MKVGDLVKFKMHAGMWLPEKYYLITAILPGKLIVLDGFQRNQVFQVAQLEVISESR